MQILWERVISGKGSAWFNCECNFFADNDHLLFAHLDTDNKITVRKINGEQITSRSVVLAHDEQPILPNLWRFYRQDNTLMLYAGNTLNLSSENIEMVSNGKQFIGQPINDQYIFGGKTINYNGKMAIECLDSTANKMIWRHKIKGYLYADIEYKNGCIIFGTCGLGSVLYCIELDSGAFKRDISNVRASHYAWHNDTIFVSDTKYNLQQVNLYGNDTLDYLKLTGGKLTDYSPIAIYNNKLYTIIFDRENSAKLLCVQI